MDDQFPLCSQRVLGLFSVLTPGMRRKCLCSQCSHLSAVPYTNEEGSRHQIDQDQEQENSGNMASNETIADGTEWERVTEQGVREPGKSCTARTGTHRLVSAGVLPSLPPSASNRDQAGTRSSRDSIRRTLIFTSTLDPSRLIISASANRKW